MALKGDRHEFSTDISSFMNEVAERGGIATYSTSGSGAALDQSRNLVTYAANASGNKPAGMLLNDMVNIDQTRQHINWHKDEVQIGGKVTLGTRGWWVTDRIVPGVNPTAGNEAYVGNSGYLTSAFENAAKTPAVGMFRSQRDEDGYAKVELSIPMTQRL